MEEAYGSAGGLPKPPQPPTPSHRTESPVDPARVGARMGRPVGIVRAHTHAHPAASARVAPTRDSGFGLFECTIRAT